MKQYILLVVLKLAAVLITISIMVRGMGYEANPMMFNNPLVIIAVSFAVMLSLIPLLEYLKKNDTRIYKLIYGYVGFILMIDLAWDCFVIISV